MNETVLRVQRLKAYYGDFQALFGVDFEVREGEVVAVIGANGAGKSTLFKAITGLLPVARDTVRWRGQAIGGRPAHEIVQSGIAMVPEGRRLFPSLSVEENLQLGAYRRRAGRWTLARVFELFPVLEARRRDVVTALSGGQQQMVAIGRALMGNPALLICDEISLGLAPVMVRDIYQAIPKLSAEGMTTVIVEQDVLLAQRTSHRLYCLQEGRVTLSGNSRELSRDHISTAYFGAHSHASEAAC
jgi:branched-chain amino acid transport system ATP-binding protein